MSCTYLCGKCGCIFEVGPNTIEFFKVPYSCPECWSKNTTHRKDLRDKTMIDMKGNKIKRVDLD